ncbi:hypothetical protein [Mycolicibacterium cosmeticum]|uniref:hypothetical protein n=1 Tax=Mycolicibacterium cosmeticum TaxID=258533 RepID=UPI0032047587
MTSATHRHGWLLCSDGARHAKRTASVMTSMSTLVSGMVNLHFVAVVHLWTSGFTKPGSLVLTGVP